MNKLLALTLANALVLTAQTALRAEIQTRSASSAAIPHVSAAADVCSHVRTAKLDQNDKITHTDKLPAKNKDDQQISTAMDLFSSGVPREAGGYLCSNHAPKPAGGALGVPL